MVNRTPNPLDIDCLQGEAVIHTPIVYTLKTALVKDELIAKVRNYLQQVANLKDDRLLVLIAELLVENAVESYLSEIFPKYNKELGENRDFTFSLKIAIAKGLRFSPSKFFDGADVVRKIRNEFVHNLEIKTFEDLKPKLVNEIEHILKSYFPKGANDKSLEEKFKSLALFTTVGITSYTKDVRSLNSFLRDDTFLDIFVKFVDK